MSRVQPFRTTRPTGSPSAGGSTHTLAAHMASNSPHPQYVRKGDAVGESNLTGHENDVNAHVEHYTRRREVAFDFDHYSGSVEIRYDIDFSLDKISGKRSIVSTYLLNQLFNTDAGLDRFPRIAKRKDVVINFSGDQGVSDNDYRVPRFSLFYSLTQCVADLYAGSKLDRDHPLKDLVRTEAKYNPLNSVFAAIAHTHSGYLTKAEVTGSSSILSFEDVHDRDNPDIIAARSDHKHEEYITEADLEKIGVTFNPDVLRKVGIWEQAVGVGYDDLDKYSTQGNYTFKVSKNGVVNSGVDFVNSLHFPEKYIEAIIGSVGNDAGYVTAQNTAEEIKSNDSLETVTVLNVTSTVHPLIEFGVTDFTPMITDFGKSYTYQVISQKLHTNAPVKYLENTGMESYESLDDYKSDVCSVYTRTGYSLESAWYISSITKLVGLGVRDFLNNVEKLNPVRGISRLFYSAVNALLGKHEENPTTKLVAGYYKYPQASSDLSGVDRIRLCPKLALVSGDDVVDVTTSEEFNTDGSVPGRPETALHRIVFNKYSGMRDISRWIMPGCLDKVTGKAIDTTRGGISASLRNLTALAAKDNKTYAAYMEYFESTPTWTPVSIKNPSIGFTNEITDDETYYSGDTYAQLPLYSPTSGLSCPYVNMDDSAEDVNGQYVGSDSIGYFAATLVNGIGESLSNVLLEFVHVTRENGDVFTSGNIYATRSVSVDPFTNAYTFTVDTTVKGSNFIEKRDSGTLYVAAIVVRPGFTPTEEESGRSWSKRLIKATDKWDGTQGHDYYRYNLSKHEFENITDVLRGVLGGGAAGEGYFSYLFDNFEEYRCPIFEDLNVVTLDTDIAKITPVPGQYTVPIASGAAIAGVDYVKIVDDIDDDILNVQKAHQAEAHTTGFYYDADAKTQAAYLILDNPDDKVLVGDEEVTEFEVLTSYTPAVVVDPDKVEIDDDYAPDVLQYLIRNSFGNMPYTRTSFLDEEDFRSAVSSGNVYSIPINRADRVVLFSGESLGTKAYGIKLPRYTECMDKKFGPSHPVYTSALFFPTVDTVAAAGKKYYNKTPIDEVYELANVSVGSSTENMYECLDLDKFFDVWCAIKQLTTEGSEHDTAHPNKLVYSIGDNGELVAWDDWNRTLTNSDIDVKKVDDLKKLDLDIISKFSMVPYGDHYRLAFDGNLLTIGDATHGHTNLDILESFDVLEEEDPLDIEGGGVLHRLEFYGNRVAYVEELAEMADLMEQAGPVLKQIVRLTFDQKGHLLVDGNQVAWHSEVEAIYDEPVLQETTQNEVVRWRHHHENKSTIDGFSVTREGDLAFNGNVIAALATSYEVTVIDNVNFDNLIKNSIWSIDRDDLNELLDTKKINAIAFDSMESLQKCTFQFKLIARAGGKTYTERDPIATFEGDDDSHLSVGFVDETMRVALPTVDYYTSFDGEKKTSLAQWAYGKEAVFDLVMVISKPGTLGTGSGQYFSNFNVLTRFGTDEDGLSFGEDKHVLFKEELESKVSGLGYVKTDTFDGKLGLIGIPANWNTLLTALVLDGNTGKVSLGGNTFLFDSDISTLVKSFRIDSDDRHASVLTVASDSTSRKKLAWLSDLNDYVTEDDADNKYMPISPVVINLAGDSTSSGTGHQDHGGTINFHWKGGTVATAQIIENARGALHFEASIDVKDGATFGGTITSSGAATIGGSLLVKSDSKLTGSLQFGSIVSGNFVAAATLSATSTALKLAHNFPGTYTKVNQKKIPTPDPNETYYTLNGTNYTPVHPTPTEWFAGTTYYTKDVNLYVDGSKIKGGGGGPGSSETYEFSVDTSGTDTEYWSVNYKGDTDPIEDKTKCSYEVVMKIGEKCVLCPMANIADTEEYNPIYVPAVSLLVCDRESIKMRIPTSWLMMFEDLGSDYSLVVYVKPNTIEE